jgi:hypothetical protein
LGLDSAESSPNDLSGTYEYVFDVTSEPKTFTIEGLTGLEPDFPSGGNLYFDVTL